MLDARLVALILGVVAIVAVVGVRLAGTDDGSTTVTAGTGTSLEIRDDDPEAYLRGSSVGDGLGGAPEISTEVREAARAADCTLRALPSAVSRPNDPQPGFLHDPERVTDQTTPPTNGYHDQLWADYGIYDEPVPYRFQVHDLEHGAVIVHVGEDVDDPARARLRALWASSPPYLLVVPETAAAVPPTGLVVTSWQRLMTCPGADAQTLSAVRAFRDAYRGTGPERAPAVNVPSRVDAPGRPEPAVPDPGAEQ